MSQGPPPPPPPRRRPAQSVEWPATSDELATLRSEFQQFRAGVIGSEDFPGGQIGTLKEGQEITRRMIAEAETHRADDVAKLHERLDDIARTLPAEVVRQINGTYIKTAEFPALVADAISDSRFAAMKIGARGFWSLLGFLVLLAGLIVTIVTRAH